MKIAVASDLHLEFGDLDFENTNNSEVLILSGDICTVSDLVQVPQPDLTLVANYRSDRYHEFFQRCSTRFPHVIYILGNHEHYNHDFANTITHLKEMLAHLPNLHVMEKEQLTIGDTTFLAGTLWTNMNREDPLTLYQIRGMMNDFRLISNSTTPVHFKDHDGKFQTRMGKFSPEDSVEEHKAMLKFIDESTAAAPSARFVVVGHHSPSKLSTKPRYQKDVLVNGAYSSDLNEFIQDRPQIKMWTHGHTHDVFDYMVGSTRIVCNPRGYHGHEERAREWELITVDI